MMCSGAGSSLYTRVLEAKRTLNSYSMYQGLKRLKRAPVFCWAEKPLESRGGEEAPGPEAGAGQPDAKALVKQMQSGLGEYQK